VARLVRKTAVVTGAAQGIGRAIALTFARDEARALALDVKREAPTELEGCEPVVIDLLEGTVITRFGKGAGRIDVLVNRAGYVDDGDILSFTDAGLDVSFDLDIRATAQMVRALRPATIAHGGGSVSTSPRSRV
jgi:2-keto-3-deoxy-L-fuconate dehydrogenase